MGKVFDNLTKTGVDYGSPSGTAAPSDPGMGGGRVSNGVQYFDHPADAAIDAARHSVAPTYRAQIPSGTLDENTPDSQPDVQAASRIPFARDTASYSPKIVKPSFNEATHDASGLPRPINPSLTKAGVLVHLLKASAEGGLAGQAAAERAVAESGGRRSAGFGTGFQAATVAPFQRVAMQNNVQQEAIDTQAKRSAFEQANTPIHLPDGTKVLPWQAKRIREEQAAAAALENTRSQTRWHNSQADRAEQDKLPKLESLHSAAVQKAVSEGRDPSQDSTVQEYADAITSLQRPLASTPYRDWRSEHDGEDPTAFYAAQAEAGAKARAKYRPAPGTRTPKTPVLTPNQSQTILKDYQDDLESAERAYRDPRYTNKFIGDSGGEEKPNPNYMPEPKRRAELERRKAAAERKYKSRLEVAQPPAASAPAASAPAASAPAGPPFAPKKKIVYDRPKTAYGATSIAAIAPDTPVSEDHETGERSYLVNGEWISESQLAAKKPKK
jgi:hypothetical protein